MSIPAALNRGYRSWDLALLLVLCPLILLPVQITWGIISFDWTYWSDWKDSVYWPLMSAPSSMLGLGAVQYLGWRFCRLPLATAGAVLATGAFLAYVSFAHAGLTKYPLNFVWPATIIPLAILLDVVLISTRSPLKAALAGAFAYGFLFYLANSVLIEPFLQPVVKNGRIMTVADLQGFEYVRSSVPGYLRVINVGGLHSFSGQASSVAALFTGLLCMGTYSAGTGLARLLVVWPLNRIHSRFGNSTQENDVSEARREE